MLTDIENRVLEKISMFNIIEENEHNFSSCDDPEILNENFEFSELYDFISDYSELEEDNININEISNKISDLLVEDITDINNIHHEFYSVLSSIKKLMEADTDINDFMTMWADEIKYKIISYYTEDTKLKNIICQQHEDKNPMKIFYETIFFSNWFEITKSKTINDICTEDVELFKKIKPDIYYSNINIMDYSYDKRCSEEILNIKSPLAFKGIQNDFVD